MRRVYLGMVLPSVIFSTAYAQDAFELAIVGDPQLSWSCLSEGASLPNTYCADPKNRSKSKEVQAEEFNKIFMDSILKLKEAGGDKFKGLVINGDLTEFGDQKGNFEKFKRLYKLNDRNYRDKLKFDIWPGLGNHDYQNNINDCGLRATPVWNKCAAVMMQFMGEWMIDAKSRGSIQNYDMPVFRKNPLQAQNQRNVTGSLSYSWQIGEFHFVQLQNYPTYTVNFKRGYSSGISSWTMRAVSANHKEKDSDVGWLEKDLREAVKSGKRIILNWHQFTAYDRRGDESTHCLRNDTNNGKVTFCQRDVYALKAMLQPFASNIDAIFIGHHHRRMGKWAAHTLSLQQGRHAIEVPVYYSGSPVAGRYLKATFNNTNKKFCLHSVQAGNVQAQQELVADCRK